MLFVSHANPEDNEFARWLSLRLAAEGYPVWCDLTRLLGGERFWTNIEIAIRDRTAKFLFVLSRASNYKAGPLDELNLALTVARKDRLKDFVIPLWIDELAAADFNVRLGGINAVAFNAGWAKGLSHLLQKLREDAVSRDPRFHPAAVGEWWLSNVSVERGVVQEQEPLATNFYPIHDESTLYIYRSAPGNSDPRPIEGIPSTVSKGLLATFTPPPSLEDRPDLELAQQIALESQCLPGPPTGWKYVDLRRALTDLLNQHWRQYIGSKHWSHYMFAGGQPSVFFTMSQVGRSRVVFRDPLAPDSKASRQLIGFKTVARNAEADGARRYWHFSLEPRGETDLGVGFLMKPHVLFSDDGETIWQDDGRLHRARRSQCKGWWNDKWRELIQAAVSYIAQHEDILDLSVGPATLIIQLAPALAVSPVRYDEALAHVEEAASEADGELVVEVEDDDEGLW